MKITLVIVGICILLVFYFISVYNTLVKEKNFVEEAFSTIDIYLKKRYDLIPNLVSTVKGYKDYEGKALENIIAARNRYMTANSIEEKVENENMITGALGKLFSLTEAYPELKANESFQMLLGELKKIEEDIMQARKYYNGSVREFTTKCEQFPSVIVARLGGFKKYPFFKLESEEERQNVKVEF